MIVMLRSWANEDVFPEDTTFIVKLEDFILTPERILDVIRSSISWCNASTDAQHGVLDSAGKNHRSTNNRSRPELVQALQDPHLFHKDVPDGSDTDNVIKDFLNLGISVATGYDRTLPSPHGISRRHKGWRSTKRHSAPLKQKDQPEFTSGKRASQRLGMKRSEKHD